MYIDSDCLIVINLNYNLCDEGNSLLRVCEDMEGFDSIFGRVNDEDWLLLLFEIEKFSCVYNCLYLNMVIFCDMNVFRLSVLIVV